MTRRTISTVHEPVSCAVCGRTLLRGEHPSAFLHAGHRRTVCELCTPRAVHDGWIREGADDARAVRRSRRVRTGGGFLDRLRVRREDEDVEELDDEVAAGEAVHGEGAPRGTFAGGEFHPGPPPIAPTQVVQSEVDVQARTDRNVHAIPTNADLKVARAMDVFNGSEHPRTVASITRSLGVPFVCVRPSATEGAVVTIVVGWELSWYRYEVDLSDEAAGVRVGEKGYELSELDPADQVANAAADEQGYLHPAATVPA
jgi:hypothetical protein